MRSMILIGLTLGLSLAACSKDAMPGGDDTGDDDPMGDDSSGDDGVDQPARGFQIQSPLIEIQPGEEVTYCYYFRTPNTEPLVIRKWSSVMTEGSHHMIYYTTANDVMPPGTVTDNGCGGFSASNIPRWTYATQTPEQEIELPQDDGTGKPLGQDIKANTAGYLEMHYLNSGDDVIEARVTLTAEAYEEGVAYTKTAPFITYNGNISIPAGAMGTEVEATVPAPTDRKFWQMSTHAHKQAIKTEVLDGDDVVFESEDWEHPGTRDWMQSPFHVFATGSLTYRCTYNNTGSNASRTVTDGPSAETDEMCMATGMYFPAANPITCFNTLCF